MQDPFIYNIAEVCARLDVKNIILSPGSRCAPLTIAFNRHPEITIRVISDERSAAYIALGLALGSGQTVGLVCTSGTAAANYLPAVAEAFYQKIPLVIFTADRPPEWINQQDNQAIQQYNLYGKHVKVSYQLPVDLRHEDAKWHMVRSVNEAINVTKEYPRGPVHLNVPIREPFYPKKDEKLSFEKNLRLTKVEDNKTSTFEGSVELTEILQKSNKILFIGGQQPLDEEVISILSSVTATGVPVIGDIVSNLHNVKDIISRPDTFLSHFLQNGDELKPELLITFGDNILSKNIKLFLRKYKPQHHWHLQSSDRVADTFQSLTKIIRTSPKSFFRWFITNKKDKVDQGYSSLWNKLDDISQQEIKSYFGSNNSGEFAAVYHFLKNLPENSNLHLANSMAVRYANLIGLIGGKDILIYSNRGTSGIDGSNSTAVGITLSDEKRENYLLTGDMAFLYDRNAFWHICSIQNLKIMVLNNKGGGIFRIIEGPSTLPELDELFETRQRFNAEYIAKEFSFEYFRSTGDLRTDLKDFMNFQNTALLEYFSESRSNAATFKNFKQALGKVFKEVVN